MTDAGRGQTPKRSRAPHIPVLLSEVLEALNPTDGNTYIDATFGAGGYTEAILKAAACKVIAFDRDPTAIASAAPLLQTYQDRLRLFQAPFSAMADTLAAHELGPIDGIVFDLGVSSMQLDQPERGFSFLHDGPLDMRMSAAPHGVLKEEHTGQTEALGPSAADVVNTMDEAELANVLYEFGEERRSRAVARAIVRRREDAPFQTTHELADCVSSVLGRPGWDQKHPATRTFQALRIYVNDELGELQRALAQSERLIKPGGRLAVVSFHSLEDRIVKNFLNEESGKQKGSSRHLPAQSVKLYAPSFRIINRRPLTPYKGELDVNPRARSARLRIAERTDSSPGKAES